MRSYPLAAKPFVTAALLGSSLLLAACAGAPRVPFIYEPENEVSQRLGEAPLPTYSKGDRFSFGGGRVEQVVAVKGEEIRWKRENGRELLRARDLSHPTLSWETKKRRGEQRILKGPGELWPLAIGKLDTFRVERNLTDKASGKVNTSFRNYDCSVETAETVTVPAGSFDTFRIACRRYNSRGSRLVETLTWNYAPKVGHYVRRETENHGSGKRQVIELKGYRRAGA